MSPGVATPCPAAPPIPIAKVCFIAPSLAPEPAYPQGLGRAQIKVCNSEIETLPPNDQLAFPVSRSIHPILPYILATQRFSTAARTRFSTAHGGEAKVPSQRFVQRTSIPPKVPLCGALSRGAVRGAVSCR